MQILRIKENDDIFSLSREYSIAPEMLMSYNGIYGVRNPPPNTELIVAIPTRTYNVRRGDTLESIAKRFGVSEEYLKQINPSLCGRCEVYPSQILAIKYQDRTYGCCVSNGYYYRGTGIDKVIRALPYLSYVTVCAARLSESGIELLFSDSKIKELADGAGKRALLRIYAPHLPKAERERRDFISSAILLAGAHGYDGITLSPPNLKEITDEEYVGFIKDFKERCNESELTLFTEGDIDSSIEYSAYSDHTILTYDKLHLDPVPTFLDGEYAKMQTFADNYEAIRAFIELPAFAFNGKKYVPNEDVARKIIKRSPVLKADEDAKLTRFITRGVQYSAYSLENTKSKLEAISELGFMGVSFDIMRTDIRELFLLCQMFSIANLPRRSGRLRCDGSRGE